MSRDEKVSEMCEKCVLLFHKSDGCTRPGRVCFMCGEPDHEARNCPVYGPSKLKSNESLNDMFYWKTVIFFADSAASHSLVGDKNVLFEYKEFNTPVKVKTANREAPLFSVGEGSLPNLFTTGKKKFIIKLKQVQFVPNVDDSIISASALNQQF